ncbi:hypothetical protein QE152_g33046 [Popillia japonica]|uniref:Uncharacterized protein n=1 Tax=Popillia japonica TaxID=7064 RepID=A0AAW1IXZ5_POPJA
MPNMIGGFGEIFLKWKMGSRSEQNVKYFNKEVCGLSAVVKDHIYKGNKQCTSKDGISLEANRSDNETMKIEGRICKYLPKIVSLRRDEFV